MFAYVVEHDFGLAPNPFFGICSLAVCKPSIRKHAAVGDLILAAGSKKHERESHLVYYMVVREALTFEEYWDDLRFQSKRPTARAGIMAAVGDNIYHRDSDGNWAQEYSLHRRAGGPIDTQHLERDTSSNRVLIGDQFSYWGGEGPENSKATTNETREAVGGRTPGAKSL